MFVVLPHVWFVRISIFWVAQSAPMFSIPSVTAKIVNDIKPNTIEKIDDNDHNDVGPWKEQLCLPRQSDLQGWRRLVSIQSDDGALGDSF